MATSNSIIGTSKSIRDTIAKAGRVARTGLPVLVTGESGTGKELFARFIHDESLRAEKPFIAVNCAAIPGELLEAELFGYKKGAFSGAVSDRDGLFVQANGGTLFLDEIGDMPLPLQAKILRVLQEGEVRPVGAKVIQKVDVRIVSATHRDLAEMARERKFREDLVFRLRGYALRLPPLRERERDVVTLARAILKSRREFASTGLSRDGQELLMAYEWPGNVRELQNVVLAAAVDAPRNIGAEHLAGHLSGGMDMAKGIGVPLEERITTVLKETGRMTLAQIHGKLKMSKPTIHRHLGRLVAANTVERTNVSGLVVFSMKDADLAGSGNQMTTRQEQAVAIVRDKGRVTRQEMAEALGISIRTASRVLAGLVSQRALDSDGLPGRMAGYKVSG